MKFMHISDLHIGKRVNEFSLVEEQKHILGEGKLLTRAIESDRFNSVILYGPPGSGKTTLARCISKKTS